MHKLKHGGSAERDLRAGKGRKAGPAYQIVKVIR